MPASKAEMAYVSQRRRDALELRLAGIDILTIGKKLAADPAINSDGIAYPQGYGNARYADNQEPPTDEQLGPLVSEDITRALKERKALEGASAADLRELEAVRLDKLTFIAYRQAAAGDLAAMDRVLRIMERRAKLLGLDAPTRIDAKVTDADLESEIERLLADLEQGGSEPPGGAPEGSSSGD